MSLGGEQQVRLLMVDDHPIVTHAVGNILAKDPVFEVHSATTGREALGLYQQLRPDIVLCDISLDADMSGLELTQRIVATDESAAVVMFTSHADEHHITAAVDAGAVGYITKGTPPDRLIEYLRAAARGEQVYDPAVAQSVVGILRRGASTPTAPVLNPRELDVLLLLCDGVVSNNEIAQRLFISPHTVKTHLDRLYTKLGVTSKTAAVVHAFRTGLVKPRDDEA